MFSYVLKNYNAKEILMKTQFKLIKENEMKNY